MSWLLKNHVFKRTLAGVAVNVSDAAMGFLLAWGEAEPGVPGLLGLLLSMLSSLNVFRDPSKTLTAFHLSTHMVNLSQVPKTLEAVCSYSTNPHLQINTHFDWESETQG